MKLSIKLLPDWLTSKSFLKCKVLITDWRRKNYKSKIPWTWSLRNVKNNLTQHTKSERSYVVERKTKKEIESEEFLERTSSLQECFVEDMSPLFKNDREKEEPEVLHVDCDITTT